MRGYWSNPDATRSTLANGWLHTGDVGSVDPDGFLTLKDRSKDLIISGGSNIYPREVEEALLLHPDVPRSRSSAARTRTGARRSSPASSSRGDAAGGERARALERAFDALVPRAHRALQAAEGLRFLAELPKNNTGKVLKTELRRVLPAR